MFSDYKNKVDKKFIQSLAISFGIVIVTVLVVFLFALFLRTNAASRLDRFDNYITTREDDNSGLIAGIIEGIQKVIKDLLETFLNPNRLASLIAAIVYVVVIFALLGVIYAAFQFMNFFSSQIILNLLFSGGDAPVTTKGLPAGYVALLAIVPSFFILAFVIQSGLIFMQFGTKKSNGYMKMLSDGTKAIIIVIALPMMVFGSTFLMGLFLRLFGMVLGGTTNTEFLITDQVYMSGWTSAYADQIKLTGSTFTERYLVSGSSFIVNQWLASDPQLYNFVFPMLFIGILIYCMLGLVVSLIVRLFELVLLFIWALFIVPTYVVDHGKKFHILKGQLMGKIWVFGTTLMGWTAFMGLYQPITNVLSGYSSNGVFDVAALGVLIAGMQFVTVVPQTFSHYLGSDSGAGHKEGHALMGNARNKVFGRGMGGKKPGSSMGANKNPVSKVMSSTSMLGK